MAIFDAYHVYSVDPHTAALDFRTDAHIVPANPHMTIDEYQLPFWAFGLRRHDLAVFANVIDENGAGEFGYLVTRTGDESELVLPSIIELDDAYLTAELARHFATVTPEEIASLGISRIIQMANKRYPNIRGFKR